MYSFLTASAPAEVSGASAIVGFVLPLVLMIAIFYFMLIRPQRKRDKAEAQMRNSLEVGDVVTTIGGIVGRVCNIKDDIITVETGADRVKIRFNRWAIRSKETVSED